MTCIAYMHTLDGKPAHYHLGMILLSGIGPVRTVLDWKTIQKERRSSIAARKALGWPIPKYSHVRLRFSL